jgi:DUF971 family protein
MQPASRSRRARPTDESALYTTVMASSYLRGDDLVAPVRIHADREAGTLRIEWADGHVSSYDFVRLRWLCPCAYCRGEMGQPGWLDSNPALSGEQTRLVSMEPVGGYAVAPTWGDGHHTGFYTFTSLRTHCPCPECTAARAAAGHPDAAIPKGASR